LIQSGLIFLLGFLCAGLIALLVAPAFLRRAAALARKRIEATVPLTLNELLAEKDRVRAEAAMTIRRLEMNVKSLNEKLTGQFVDTNRHREELKRLAAQLAEKDRILAEHDRSASGQDTARRERQEQLPVLSKRLNEAERLLEERTTELRKLEQLYDEVSFVSSSRQIELAAREAEIEKLATDMSRLRGGRKGEGQRAQDALADNQVLQEALEAERKRAADLERNTERMQTSLSELEGKLELREKDLARLREQLKESGEERVAPDAAASRATSEEYVVTGPTTDAAERERLKSRLTTLTRENRKLRAQLTGGGAAGPASGEKVDAALREQIQNLAAEVVHLTAIVDGSDSPIYKALGIPTAELRSAGASRKRAVSLAERIRALRKAAVSTE
jgi:DNA repair exonuclease SbcCD ATPase subunit